MRTHDDLFNPKQQLQAIRGELQTNRSTLNELFDCYRMFLFTGGTIPLRRWDLGAIASYIERPWATDRIMLDDVVRYRHLAEAIMEVGKEVSASGPKSVRKRHSFTDTFRGLFAEIRALASALESSATNALATLPTSLAVRKSGVSTEVPVATSIGGDEIASMLIGRREGQAAGERALERAPSDDGRWVDDGGQG
jgi:hypothetical protein